MENENKQENAHENKFKFKIYEDQTQIHDFVEPEWMKILKVLIEQNKLKKLEVVQTYQYLVISYQFMVRFINPRIRANI